MSAGKWSAKAMPPAAETARFDADLSIVAPEAILASRPFEPKPGKPDQLVALHQSRRGANPCRFPHAGDSPATGARLAKIVAIT